MLTKIFVYLISNLDSKSELESETKKVKQGYLQWSFNDGKISITIIYSTF